MCSGSGPIKQKQLHIKIIVVSECSVNDDGWACFISLLLYYYIYLDAEDEEEWIGVVVVIVFVIHGGS